MIPVENWENLTIVLSIIYLGGKIINKSRGVITIIEGKMVVMTGRRKWGLLRY